MSHEPIAHSHRHLSLADLRWRALNHGFTDADTDPTAQLLAGWSARLQERTAARQSPLLPVADGVYGAGNGPILTLCVMGDSLFRGLGAAAADKCLPAFLAEQVVADARAAGLAGARVRLIVLAEVGARSDDLHDQVRRALGFSPDIVVVDGGANDVRDRRPLRDAVDDLKSVTRRLVASGAEVVVGTCPELGVNPLPRTARLFASWLGHELSAHQADAATEVGARVIALHKLGPGFAANPHWFSGDEIHPSEEGQRQAAAALRPAVVDAVNAVVARRLGTPPTPTAAAVVDLTAARKVREFTTLAARVRQAATVALAIRHTIGDRADTWRHAVGARVADARQSVGTRVGGAAGKLTAATTHLPRPALPPWAHPRTHGTGAVRP